VGGCLTIQRFRQRSTLTAVRHSQVASSCAYPGFLILSRDFVHEDDEFVKRFLDTVLLQEDLKDL